VKFRRRRYSPDGRKRKPVFIDRFSFPKQALGDFVSGGFLFTGMPDPENHWKVSMKVSGKGSFSPLNFSCMKRAFSLALRGKGKTSPNPMVGALLAKNNQIIGEGWHRRHGGAHAEAGAIQAVLAAGLSPAGADLYCTLEPCCFNAPDKHQPPCTDLIIKGGVKRVYIANFDPNPRVSGKGIAILEEAGIEVRTGLCFEAGEELNRAFFTFHRLGRPFIHLKIAQSLDGRIAAPDGGAEARRGRTSTPDSGARWISDEKARRMVHRLRSFYDAVLIGRGTALADDPELTVRLVKGRNPLRVVLDSRLSISVDARLFALSEPEKTIIIHNLDADAGKAAKLRSLGAELIPIKAAGKAASGDKAGSGGLPLKKVLAVLGKRGVQSILVEGGAEVFGSFLREGFWDRLSIFIAPMVLGGGVNAVTDLGISSIAQAMRFKKGAFSRFGSQMLFEVNRETESQN